MRDDWDINDLVAYLHRSQRSRVTVLLSVPQRQVKPPVDGNALKRRLGAKADVVVVPAALTYKLTDTLGRRQSAFGGAARVYPCDDEWLSDHYQIELIQPKSGSSGFRVCWVWGEPWGMMVGCEEDNRRCPAACTRV